MIFKNNQKIKVGFLTSRDPKDPVSWSGTYQSMLLALEREFEVHILGPVPHIKWIEKVLFFIQKTHKKFFSKNFNTHHNLVLSFYYSYKFYRRIKSRQIDVIFAPAASTEIAFLYTKIPICYLSDTSFGQICDYYPIYSNLSSFSRRESNFIERKAIKNSSTLVYSSNWAAQYVIENYNVNPKKVFTFPFGANFINLPKDLVKKDFAQKMKILFLGVDWYRKGGDIVLECYRHLKNRGYHVELTICGCNPKGEIPSEINVIPHLRKNTKSGDALFEKLLNEAHLLFVPSRADCTPIVFSEAAAFGIPVLTTATGGISSIIEDGINGFALPQYSPAQDYAQKIIGLIEKPERLEKMSISSRLLYKKELNWNTWGSKMKNVLQATIEK